MWKTVGFVLLCLLLPIVWGVLVNRLFDLWKSRKNDDEPGDNDPIFPDYQI